MNLLIKEAMVYDKNSPFHLQLVDILINRSKIVEIGKNLSADKAKEIRSKNLCVSPGWLDIGTTLTEPGFEDLDDLGTLTESAAAGGFTALAVFPNTNPVLDNKGALDSLKFRSADKMVEFFPIASLTVGTEGMDISEMADLKEAGAVAFSDGKKSIQHAGVIKRAFRYTSTMDSMIVNHPNDKTLSETGIMNESAESAFMGMKGIPGLAEEISLHRDLQLCEYNDAKLLSHMITTRESVKLVKKAKQSDIKVSASVSFHNLVATDSKIRDFDSMHKVLPPLRTKADVNALIKGLQDGTIDCIVSNHTQIDVEDKKKAFYYAGFGALGLEQMFSVLNEKIANKLTLELLVEKLSHGPRQILNIPVPEINKGVEANLTLFDPEMKWTFKASDIKSKSKNAPFLGEELTGKVIGVISKGSTNIV